MTLDQLLDIAYKWSEAYFRADDCQRHLHANGHSGFLKYQDYQSSYAECQGDIEIHNVIRKETARRAAICAPVISYHSEQARHRWYRPAIIEERRLVLAKEAGYSTVEEWIAADNPTPTQLNPDPVMQAISSRFGMGADRHVVEEFDAGQRMLLRANLEAEADRFRESDTLPFTAENRKAIFRDASVARLGRHGFQPRTTRLSNYVALDLDVSPGIVLRWSLGEEDRSFDRFPMVCDPVLCLRERRFSKRFGDGDRSTRYLVIRYDIIVEGLAAAYLSCENAREMMTILNVRCLVVEWVLPYVLDAVRSTLDGGV